MDWLTRMNDAIALMEERLEGRLDIAEIARAAYVSPFHFQRMFGMVTGMTVAEYMRKRKLTKAAQELAAGSARVVDVALKYGYDTPESFAKAFRRIHGVAPSEARNPGVSLKAFPRISFHLSLRGDKDMDYRMIEKDAFTVVGTTRQVSCCDGAQSSHIGQFWGQCHADGTVTRLGAIGPDGNLLGIILDMQPDQEAFTYMIASVGSLPPDAEGLTQRTIPAATWAIFTAVGPVPQAITSVFGRIFQEWLPATGYEVAEGPEMEVYLPGDVNAADYRSEVWIPIARK
ncbi:MAG TPA: AraC family transcriptional regulator [Symbiobacteriaceae bacterium]|nr:AraC family transcriptional regulator [Symbiobacteriaceae bacterium]